MSTKGRKAELSAGRLRAFACSENSDAPRNKTLREKTATRQRALHAAAKAQPPPRTAPGAASSRFGLLDQKESCLKPLLSVIALATPAHALGESAQAPFSTSASAACILCPCGPACTLTSTKASTVPPKPNMSGLFCNVGMSMIGKSDFRSGIRRHGIRRHGCGYFDRM